MGCADPEEINEKLFSADVIFASSGIKSSLGLSRERPAFGDFSVPQYLATLPAFLTWFPISAALLALFGAIYLRITPWHELRLIRAGNAAAAASFAGALLGYALVLASVLAHAVSRGDLLTWGLIGLIVQVLAFYLARLLLGADLTRRMEAGQVSSGLFLGVVSLAAGVLNAATMIL